MFLPTRAINVMTARVNRPARRRNENTYERKERGSQERDCREEDPGEVGFVRTQGELSTGQAGRKAGRALGGPSRRRAERKAKPDLGRGPTALAKLKVDAGLT